MKIIQIFLNASSREELDTITESLLTKKLIACADTFPVESSYWWKGKIAREKRWQAIAFTRADKKSGIIELVEKSHSDEVPAIIFLPIEMNKKCSDWIGEVLR